MTPPRSPATDLVDRLGDELAEVSRRIESIRHDLGTLRTAPAVTPPAMAPPGTSPPAFPWGPPAGWSGPPSGAWGPPPPPWPAPPSPAPPPPAHPGAPRPDQPRPAGTSAGTIARLLAITGAGVTLLGVVLLLVLAASRGWLSPGARVAAGAALGLALAGAGIRLHRRGDGDAASAGAVALVATGVAALYLTVAAASALYTFLPVLPALLLALLVTGAGLALADRWRHRGLAIGVLVGGDLLVPLVVGSATSLFAALLLAAAIAALPVALRRDWSSVATVALIGAALGGFSAAVRVANTQLDRPGTVAVVLGIVVVGVATVLVWTRARPALGPGAAARLGGSALGAPVFALLVLAIALPRSAGAVVALVAAVLLLVLVIVLDRGERPAPQALALVAGAGAAVAVLVATVLAVPGDVGYPFGLALLGEALVLLAVAHRTGRRGVLTAAAPFALAGLVVALAEALPLSLLVEVPTRGFVVQAPGSVDTYAAVPGALIGAAGVALLLVALGIGTLVVLARLGLLADGAHRAVAAAGLGLIALYGATGTVVSLALLVAPSRAGFLTGHVLVTVSWTAVALVLLARGLRASLPRVLGGVLVIAAVGKLILFDLTALDGIARVAAFLGAGIVLLVAGARYARALADDTAPTG